MGSVTYFYVPSKGRNNHKPWAIAMNAGEWNRSLHTRGWTTRREVYSRPTTPAEDEIIRNSMRCIGGRYESLDKLLEDEREILESEDFAALETALRKHEGELKNDNNNR